MRDFLNRLFGRKDKHDLAPGESVDFMVDVPPGIEPDNLGIRVIFDCKCGRTHEKLVSWPGGAVVAQCECGRELKLEVGPAEQIAE